ncbi:hypothetical protein GCM10010401_11260 [Rarobacter faecitabidus]|nr:ElyC/SanA/YdcF family protein [Rarobacter faecitabidus]
MIAMTAAASLLPGLVVAAAPSSNAASLPPASIAQAEARAIEFQRIGLLDDVQEQLAHIKTFNQAEGVAFAAATDFWNNSLVNYQIQGNVDPTQASGIPDGLPNQRSHVFVVLGHVLNNDGTPQQQLLDRVEVAKTAAAKYPNARIMVTGGQPRNGHTEGQVMHDLLVGGGISENRIIVENQSSDTPDNSTMSMAILYGPTMVGADRVDSISLITAGWHMRRGTILYQYASRLTQARNNADHLIEIKAGAACITSACQNGDYVNPPGYPNSNERNLIAQNVAKVAGVNVGGSDGNGGELSTFRTGTGGLRRAIAKFVYLQREGFAGNDAAPRNNTADLRRAIADLGDVSSVYGREFGELNRAWDAALRPLDITPSIPTLPSNGSGHAFVVLGADSGTGNATAGRLNVAVTALNQYPNAIAVVAGNQAEIDAGYNGLISRGISASRIVRTQAGSNAQTGAFQSMNTLYSLGNISKYTLITSGDYVRRPLVLFAVADMLRRNAWGSATKIELAGHIVETLSGRSGDASLPDSTKRNQIIDNVDDLFDFSASDLSSWNTPAPVLSTLAEITATPPVKTAYVVGDAIDTTGLKVQAKLDNGTVRVVDVTDLATLTLPSTTAAGPANIAVSYTYRGTTKSAQVPVTVRAANVDALTSALDEAAAITPDDFTAESYAALTAAVSNASTVIADLQATSEEVANARTAVQAALDGLVALVPTVQVTLTTANGNGTYPQGATATVTATPALAERPVASIEYATTGTWQAYSGPVTLPVGGYQFRARATDSVGRVSAVATLDVVVVAATPPITSIAPTLTVAAPSARFGAGAKVTVKARANGAAVSAGTVTVQTGAKVLGTGKITAGQATISLDKKLKVGKYPISVRYFPVAGTALLPAVVPRAGTVTIGKAAPKITVKRTKGTAKRGSRVTLRVRIAAIAGAAPSGAVTITLGGKKVGKAKIRKSGKFCQATIKTKKLARKGKLKASYTGNATYAKKTVTSKVKIK